MKRTTINGNISHIAYYANAQVRQNGRIFPWGAFRIISDEKEDDPSDNSCGLYCWCEKLIEYDTQHYMIDIDDDNLLIKKRTDGRVVETFALYGFVVEVFVPHIEFLKIGGNGTLQSTPLNNIGDQPDNHFFTFDQQYAGTEVIKLAFHGWLKPIQDIVAEDYLFVTNEGKKIPFEYSANNLMPAHRKEVFD
ncbi:MAG: hypothetical protein KBB54_01275 [Candidatus Pacebacteria bacterium]|jgi:hypothetical protein|nr:hypothetical protein [Candidatus Paceibacterota bacterium]